MQCPHVTHCTHFPPSQYGLSSPVHWLLSVQVAGDGPGVGVGGVGGAGGVGVGGRRGSRFRGSRWFRMWSRSSEWRRNPCGSRYIGRITSHKFIRSGRRRGVRRSRVCRFYLSAKHWFPWGKREERRACGTAVGSPGREEVRTIAFPYTFPWGKSGGGEGGGKGMWELP